MKVALPPQEDQKGALLDSGSTHVLRPAKDEEERAKTQQVYVTLAGDERKLLDQTPSGSIIVGDADAGQVQSIIPFGKVIECLRLHFEVDEGWISSSSPSTRPNPHQGSVGMPRGHGRRTSGSNHRGVGDETGSRAKGKGPNNFKTSSQPFRMMQQQSSDWRAMLAKYVDSGEAVNGLQSIYLSPNVCKPAQPSKGGNGARD